IGLVGPNGAGKSTLLALVLQRESPDSGEITMQRGVSVGYLPQETVPPTDQTVLEVATSAAPLITRPNASDRDATVDPHDLHDLDGFELEPKAKKVLCGLGFRESDFDRPCRQLSGGWIMRAHLARLLVQEPALLMLDEPTNHLDLEAVLWLQEYLRRYLGA